MAEITAKAVSELRDKTGVSMMECKKALVETNGNLDAAVDLLRKKGQATAEKKGGRIAADGLIGVAVSGNKAAIVEVNAETDFVAKNSEFQEMVGKVSNLALTTSTDVEKIKAAPYGNGVTVGEHVTNLIAKIGENMGIRRADTISVSNGVIASYMHNASSPTLGKIGVLVALESTGDKAKLEALGKQIAMHIAAANPQALTSDKLDQSIVERERAIFSEQATQSGKPADIVAKMVEGRLRKFYEEVCLMDQVFVVDGESKISAVVEKAAKDIGAPVKIAGFVRFALGEGIQKKESDFAAEVAAMSKSA